MRKPRRHFPLTRAVLMTAAFLLPQAMAQTAPATGALPSGGQVAAGQVSLATSGPAAAPTLTVTQGSDRAIVNWAAFDVGRDATVRFDQPSASAAILNRVVGADPSRIFGRLTANGQVFLVNPNGVYFSPTSSVDVGAFVASTLSIGDADFLAGRLDFRRLGATGTIVNEGAIRSALGGYVALLAPEVRNAGLIMAEAGSVLLAAGEAVSFNFDPAAGVTGLLVEPSHVQALVDNGRIVRAPGGQVIVSAQAHNEMAAGVIRNTGEIAANGITTDGGRVMLGASDTVEQGGLVDASSATGKGGSVDITAPTIALLDASSLLATGELGGGRIHVGGGWQGAGPLPQARRVTQAANSLIDASAIRLGRGGEVVLWSDVRDILSLTQAVGVIRARGGELGGDGGRVETSGYGLQVSGISVDTLSPKGRTGEWLLDPVNITIAASGGNLTPDQLRDGLLTSNVTISTAGAGSATGVSPTYSAGAGDITISSLINSLSPNSLTLNADNNINITAIVAMGGGLTLNAGGSINLGANIITGGDQNYNGPVNLTSGIMLESTGWIVTDYLWQASLGALNARFGGTSATFRVVGGTGAQGGSDGLVGMAGGASGDYTATVAFSGVTDAVIHAGTGGAAGANSAQGSGGGAGGAGRAGYQGGAGGNAGGSGSSGAGGGGGAASVVAILGGTIVGGGGGGGAGGNNVSGDGETTGQGATSQVASGNAGEAGGFGGTPLADGGGSGGGGGGILGGRGGVGVNGGSETSGRGGFAGTSGAVGVTVTGVSQTTYAAAAPNAGGTAPAAGREGFIQITGRLVASSTPGNITFASTINGAHSLTISTGSGTVTFGGNVGGTTPIGALNVSGAGALLGAGTGMRTILSGGNQSWNAPLALDSRSLWLETRGAAGSTFVIDLNQGLTKASGGDITVDLRAHRDIFIGGSFTPATGKVDLRFEADYDSDGVTVSRDGVGFIQVGGSISTNGGALRFGSGATATVNGASTLVGGDVYVTGASAATFNTGGGAFEVQGELLIGNASGLSILTGGGAATFAGAIDAGNTYNSVVGNVLWTTALANAASGTQGAVGSTYLATITSRLENMVVIRAASYDTAWLAGRRTTGIGTNQVWRWVAGPEGLMDSGRGLQFFTQNFTGAGGTAIGGAYTNWNGGEPNNSGGANTDSAGEPYLQFAGASGTWNDLSTTTTWPNRYVRETLLAASPLTVDAGVGAVTFSGAIGQKKALGNTAVTGGAITFGAATSVGANTLTVTASTSTTATAGAITAASLVLQGAGAHTFTNAGNNITTLAAGTVAQPVGAISVRDADSLTIGTVGSVSGVLSGGAVSLTSSAQVIVASSLTTSAGNLTISAAGFAGWGSVTVPSGISLDITQSGSSAFAGIIDGAGVLTKAGAGALSLTGANTFTGGTTVTAGTIGVYHNTALGTGALNIGGSTLRIGRAVTQVGNDIAFTDATTVVFDTAVDYLLVGGGGGGGAHVGGGGGGGGVVAGSTTLGAGTSAISVGGGGTGSTNTNGSTRTAATGGGSTTALGFTALGGGAGGNWTTINATSGATGGGQGANQAAAAGTVGQGFAGGVGDGIATYGYLSGGGGGAGGVGGSATSTKSGDGGIGALSRITGADAYYGGGGGGGVHTAGLGSPGLGGLGGGGNGAVDTGTRAPDGAANTGGGGGGSGRVSSALSIGGNGGSGLVIVSYLGASAGTGGTVSAGTAGAAGRTLHTFTNTGAGSLVLSALNTVLSGALSGSGAVTLNATGGTLSLSGANASTGTTLISGGTVRIGAGGGTGTPGAGAITNNGALVFNRTGTLTVANAISGTGSLEQLGSGVTVLSGAVSHTGGTTVTAGTLRVGAGGTSGTLAGNVVTQSVLAFDRSDEFTFAGAISGSGGVTQAAASNLILTGAATFTGVTTVDAGGIVFRRDVPPTTSGFAGAGTVIVEPSTASFTSGFTASFNFASTLTGLTLGKSGNASAVTINSAVSIAGPIRVFGGNVTANAALRTDAASAEILLQGSGFVQTAANLTTTGATSPIRLLAGGYVNLSVASALTTSGSNVLVSSNTDATGGGYIYATGNQSIVTSGGSVTFGGGDLTGSGYAEGMAAGNAEGIRFFNALSIDTSVKNAGVSIGGGDIVFLGRSFTSANTASGAFGFGVETTTTLDSGTGTIRIDGISRVSSGDAHTQGIRLLGNVTATSASTSATAIHVTGAGGSVASSYAGAQGVRFAGTNNLLTTTGVGGGIKLSGTPGAQPWAIVFLGGSILSASGPIELSGTTAGSYVYLQNVPTLGFKAGTAVTSSTANILLSFFDADWGGSANPIIATSGSFTFRPSGSSFNRVVGTSWFDLPTTLSALTLGSATNTSGLALNTVLNVQGPVTAQGGYVEVSQAITAAGDVLIDGDSGSQLTGNFHGINHYAAVTTTAASNGNITLIGRGGSNAVNYGINLTGAGTLTAGGSGAISVTGQGGVNAGATNLGVRLAASLTTGSGNITVTGTGGGTGAATDSDGLRIIGGGTIRTTTGAVLLVGNAGVGTGSEAVAFANGSGTITNLGHADQSGNITIRGNTFSFEPTINILGSGVFTVEPTGASFTSTLNAVRFTEASTLTGYVLGKSGNTAAITVDGAVSVAGPISITGGAVTLSSAIATTSGNIDLNVTTLTGVGGITIPSDGTLTITQSGSSTYGGVISGGGAFTKAGEGELALSATSTFTGATSISAGTLALGGGGTSGWLSGTSAIAVDGTLQIWRSDDVTISLPLSGAGTLEVRGAYRSLFTSQLTTTAQTVASNTTVSEVLRRIAGGQLNGTAVPGTLNAAAYQVTFDPIANVGRFQLQFYDGTYVKTVFVRLVQSGTNVQALVDVASPYTKGTAYLQANQLGQNMATFAGVVYSMDLATTNGGGGYGVSRLDVTGKATLANLGSFSGTLRLTTATETGTGLNVFTRTIPGTLEITGGFGSVSSVVNNGLLIINNSTSTTLSAPLSGTGAVHKYGTGAATLAQDVTYAGETLVGAGGLTLQGNYASALHTILSAGTLTLDVASGDRDFAAATFRGNGTLAKSGDGRALWSTSVATFALGSGALIDVQGGIFTGSSNSNEVWTNNFADLNVASGARLAVVEGAVRVDALTGAGDITVGLAGGFGSLTLGVDNHTASTYSTAGSATFSGVIADTGASATGLVIKLGTGTQILTGANTYSRGTTLSAGTLQVGVGGAAGTLAGNIVNNSSLIFDRSDDSTFAGVISGTGAVAKLGAGVLSLTGANTYSGVTNLTGGTLRIGDGSTSGTLGTGSITNNGVLSFDRSDFIAVSGVISGTGSVSSGQGFVALTGANTYSGGTTITGGTIGAYHNTALGTGTLTIGGATLQVGRAVTTLANAITLTGATSIDLDAAVEYLIVGGGGSGVDGYGGGGGAGGFLTGSMELTGAAYALTVGAGGAQADRTGPGAGNNGVSSTAFGLTAFGGGAGGTYGTGVPNSGASGGGGGANGSAGAAGTAGQGFAGGAGDGSSPVFAGGGGGGAGEAGAGAITSGGAGGAGLSSTISGELRWYAGGGGGSAWAAGINGGAGGLGGGGGGASNAGVVGSGGLAYGAVSGATATRFNGGAGAANTGGGGGGGQSGGNAYTGGVGGAGGSGVVVARYLGGSAGTGGTVTAGTGTATGYTLHTFTTTGASTLTLSTLSTTLSGAITGTGNLTTDATGGTLILTGANTYVGATTIPGGTVRVGAGGATGTLGAGAITNNGTLVFNRTGTLTVTGAISGTGSVEQAGSGTTVLEGDNSFSGGTTITAGTLRIGAGGTTGALTGAVANSGTLIFNRSNDTTYAGVISGSGSVTKLGTGVLTYAGANTYSGATTISGGTLRVGDGATAGTLGTGAITNDGILSIDRSDLVVIPVAISGTGSVTSSQGVVALTGANTYSGGTTITGGVIGAYHNTALGSGTLTIGDASLLIGRSVSTLANAITLTGALTVDFDQSVIYLLIGGGGGGGGDNGGGGGAGGFLTGSATLNLSSYATMVGAGGAGGAPDFSGANGANSTFNGLTAVGGGGGGGGGAAAQIAGNGGSGGGGDGEKTASSGGTGTTGQGFAGGASNGAVGNASGGGGGGGAGAAGTAATGNDRPGNGGIGRSSEITGTLRWYAGGGGGGPNNLLAIAAGFGLGGQGGGGAGGLASAAQAGTANTGGGGGGAGDNGGSYTGGAGGSGILVVRYLGGTGGTGGTVAAGTGTATGYTVHSFTTTGASTLALNALSATLSGAITGTGNLTTDATGGTLIFSGANTYDGTTTIPGGTVRVGAGGATGTLGAGAITNNGALIFNRTGTLTVGGVISGTGALEQAGTGTTVLVGVNTYSGTTTVSAGTLAVTDDAGLGTTAAGTTVASGASLDLRNALVGAESLVLNGGTLMASTGTSTLTGAVTLGASSTLSVAGTQLTLGGVISGTNFGLTKTGAGVAILTGANTFTGAIAVNDGTLRIGGAGSLTAGTYVGALTVASGATFDYASSANQVFGTSVASGNVTNDTTNTLRGAGAYVFGGTGAVTLRGDFSTTGTVAVGQALTMTGGTNNPKSGLGRTSAVEVLDGGTITLAGAANSFIGYTVTSALTLRAGGKLTTDGTAGQTFHLGVINLDGGELATGAGATITNWGIYNLDSTITVTADSTISAQFSSMWQSGGTVFNVDAGKTLTVSGTLILPSAQADTGLVLNSAAGSTGTMVLSGVNTYAGATTIHRGTLRIGGAGQLGSGTYANTVTSNGALEVATSANQTFSNVISGSGTLTQSGSGTTIVSANNTYTGATTVSAGVLQVGNGGTTGSLATASSLSIAAGATLRYFRGDISPTTVTVANSLTGDGTLEFRSTGGNGAGQFELTGANTLSSSAVVRLDQARLIVESQSRLGSGAPLVRVLSGGQLFVIRTATISSPLELGAGLGWKESNGSQLGMIHANGWVSGGAGPVTFTGNVTLTGDSAIAAWDNQSDVTMSGVISDGGNGFGFTKLGALRLTLSGANTFTGTTTISAGTLQVGAGGTTGIVGGPVVNNAALAFSRSDDLTFAPAISGTGTLTKLGANTLTLPGASTYTGTTTVTAGGIVFRRDTAPSTSGFSGAGVVTIEPAGSAFGSALSAGYAFASTLTGLTLGKSGNTSGLTIPANISLAGPISLFGGDVTLTGGLAATASGDILVRGSGVVTIAAARTLSSTNGDVIVTAGRFVNNSGSAALSAGGTGKTWRVWSSNADPYHVSTGDVTGGLAFDFRQYDATYGTSAVLGTGKGLLYTLAPSLTAAFTSTPTKVYDQTDAAAVTSAMVTASGGFVGGDTNATFTITGATYASRNAGTGQLISFSSSPTVIVQTSSATGSKPVYGYQISGLSSLTGDITPLELMLTGVTAVNKVYDRTLTAVVSGGSVTPLSGDVVTVDTSAAAGSFADWNVGTAKTVVVSGVVLGGADAGNYTVGQPSGLTADITSRPLTVTGVTAANKIYDRSVTATLSGGSVTALSGDTVNLVTAGRAGAFADWNVGTAKAVTASGYALGGADAGNYVIVQPTGLTADITALSLAVTGVTAANKVYDRDLAATLSGGSVAPISGDTVTLEISSAAGVFADWNVGTGKSVTASGYALTGNDAGNYAITQPTGITADITALSLAVTGVTAVNKVYDRTDVATLSGGAIAPITGDTVTLDASAAAGVFADRDVGIAKGVTASGYVLGGADAGNYHILQPTGLAADITARSLTISGLNPSKVYDRSLTASVSGATVSPISGDTVTVDAAAATGLFADWNVGTGKPVTYAGFALSGSSAGNYVVVQPTGVTGDITALSLAVTGATAANKTYDALLAATISGGLISILSGDDVTLDISGRAGVFADKNVGVGKSVTVSGYALSGADAANYAIVQPTGVTADISALSLAVTGATAANKTYDQLLTAAISGGSIAPISGDTVSLVSTNRAGVFGDKNVGTGKSVTVSGYALSGADAANYAIVQPTGVTADITALSLAVTGATAAHKTYDALLTAAISGGSISVISGDTVTLGISGRTGVFADKNVGSAKSVTVSGYTITGIDAANYSLVQPTGLTADITALSLAVTGATAAGKTYDAQLAATISGGTIAPISGDTVTLVTSGRAGVFADKNVGNGKSVTVSGYTISGADAANYVLVQPTGLTADITHLTLNVTGVTAADKTYDALLVAAVSGGSISVLAGDTVTLDISGRDGVFGDKNVGTGKSVTVSGYTISGADAGNYSLVQPTGVTADITALSLAVTGATAANKTYDQLLAAAISGGTVAPISGDTVTLDISGRAGVFADKNVGSGKSVTVSGYTISGTDAGNYALVQPTGVTADITALSLAVTGAIASNKTYDALLAAAISGGSISVLAGDTVTLDASNRAGVFADKNVATGKSVTVSGYTIIGTDAANYALVQPTGVTADITALSLAVTGVTAANKTYDALLNAAISGGSISVISGDTVTLDISGRAGVFADKNVGTSKSVTVSGYMITGTDAGNYSLIQPTGVTADITALSLVVTGATAANKTYDAQLAAAISGGSISVIAGDTVSLDISGRAGLFGDKNVGTGKSVTVSGYTISGADAANYSLVQPSGVTADITALSLAVTGAAAANKTYDAQLSAAISGGAISIIAGDNVVLDDTNRAGLFGDKNVGAAKGVTVSGYTLTGTDAANYSLVQPTGLTADITALSLAVTGATAGNKTYDALLTAAISGGAISILSGDVVILDVSGRAGLFADKNVGAGKSVTVSGYTISGTDAGNYSLIQPTGVTADITALSLAVTGATAANKTYDQLLTAAISGGSISIISGDAVTLDISGRAGIFADKNVGTGKSVTVSGYTISGADAANYSLVQPVGLTADISALSLAVTGATAANKTYDALLAAAISGGSISVISGDAVTLDISGRAGVFADKNVGTGKSVTVSGYTISGADAANYSLVQPIGLTADITALSLAVTGATAAHKTYDALLNAAISGGSISVISGDTVTLDISGRAGVFADKNVGTGKSVTVSGYTISGADAANYSLVQPTGVTADITALSLAVTGATAANKTYDALLAAAISGGAISIIAGDSVTLDDTNRAGLFADKNVGTGKNVTVSGYALTGTDAANYALVQPVGLTADITALSLAVTGAAAANKTYDQLLTAVISGGTIAPISGDTVTLVTSGRAGLFDDKNVGTGKDVTVTGYTISGADAANYSLVQPTGVSADITQLTLNLTGVTAADKVYDQGVGATLAGGMIAPISGDAVSLVTAGRSGSFADKNVGTAKSITVSGYAIAGADAGNYALAQPTGVTASITQLTLNLTGVTAAHKVYDQGVAAALSGGIIAPISGDAVTLDISGRSGVFADKNVGTAKSVTVSGYALTGADATNYSLVQPVGLTADISVLSLAVTGATAASKTYDQLRTADISGGVISAISGDDVTLVTAGRAGLFGDKNVGTGKNVTVTGYTISGADAANYSLVQPTGVTADITARSLAVTGATAASKTYDRLVIATISGGVVSVISGDDVALDVAGRSGVFADWNVGTGKSVTVSGYAITGADAANYSLVQPTGLTADITALSLAVTGVNAADKTYDRSLLATISGGTISVIGGDTVVLDDSNRAGLFGDKNVGTGKSVTVTGYTISGADAANYSLVQPTSVTADITALSLAVTGVTASDKVYDRSRSAVLFGGAIAPLGGDDVILDGSAAAGLFADKNVGVAKAVTATGFALIGADALNYAIMQPTGMTANITVRTVAVTGVQVANKTSDGNLTATLSGGTVAAISGDAVTLDVSFAVGAFLDSTPGTGKPVTASGYALTGLDSTNYSILQPTGLTADITAVGGLLYPNVLATQVAAPSEPVVSSWTLTPSTGLAAAPTPAGVQLKVSVMPVSADATDSLPIGQMFSIASVKPVELQKVSLEIVSGFVPGRTILEVSIPEGLDVAVDNTKGTITITGKASSGDYEKLLRGVKLRSADGQEVGGLTLRVGVTDETGTSQSGDVELRRGDVATAK